MMDMGKVIRDAFGRSVGRTEHSDACPDCDATFTMREESPGLFVATVEHDATCPTYQRLTGGGNWR